MVNQRADQSRARGMRVVPVRLFLFSKGRADTVGRANTVRPCTEFFRDGRTQFGPYTEFFTEILNEMG